MAAIISYGRIHIQSPQQNGGVCLGETNMEGWDASQKTNLAHASLYGAYSVVHTKLNMTNDATEMVDGVVNDMDVKISWNVNM